MLTPLGEAQPTKVGTTLLTLHVIAPLVFLYVGATFRTGFAIGLNPTNILRVRLLLLLPFINLSAISWLMSFVLALYAESIATSASDRIIVESITQINQQIAILLRTPLDLLI